MTGLGKLGSIHYMSPASHRDLMLNTRRRRQLFESFQSARKASADHLRRSPPKLRAAFPQILFQSLGIQVFRDAPEIHDAYARAGRQKSAFAQDCVACVHLQGQSPTRVANHDQNPRLIWRDPKSILKLVDPFCDCSHGSVLPICVGVNNHSAGSSSRRTPAIRPV
jgi:hypothetical protein